MAITKEYSKLLQNEHWKEKRLEILKRDNNQCTYCGKEGKLFVHHKYYMRYRKGEMVNPWEYPNNALVTVCYGCHKKLHRTTEIWVKYISK